MAIELDFENRSEYRAPDADSFLHWISTALEGVHRDAELSIRIVDEAEMIELNGQFRNQPISTNVLSFPADIAPELAVNLLGDIAICAAVIEREAAAQQKTIAAHYAHMSVHGTLHLLGYDHLDDTQAETMETLEIRLLSKLGFDNPYAFQAK